LECKSCGAIINGEVCEYCGTSVAGKNTPPVVKAAATNAAPARKPATVIAGFFILFMMIFGAVYLIGSVVNIVGSDSEKNQALVEDEKKADEKTAFDIYVEENDVTLTGRDVMYDAKNTFDKPFVIEGNGELNTYFNYEWRGSDTTHFCVRIRPDKGSDSWYVYFARDNFTELFEDLKDGKTQIRLVCRVPKEKYKDNQSRNDMAEAVYASWK